MARKWGIVVPALTAAALVGSSCSTTSTRAQPIPLPDGGAVAVDLPATRPATIEQPLVTDLQVAAESRRVDLAMPTLSDPANVTNPLFPISSQESVLMLGHVDGQPFRTEVTLLPDTRSSSGEARRSRRWSPSTSRISAGACTRSRTTSTRTTTPATFGTSARTSSTSRTAPSPTPTAPGSRGKTARPR